jgi:predicted nucleotidyltransferase
MKRTILISKDFKEFAELLEKNEVNYLVIGGFAVNFHGYPRYTKDIDIWIQAEEATIQKLLITLNEFGFGSLGLCEKDFLNKDNIIQLGYEPNRIDLLVSVDGLDFKNAYEKKIVYESDGVKMNFVSIDDLIIAKKTSGRPQDLADADYLTKLKEKAKIKAEAKLKSKKK